jgi:hypothetical protein
MKRETFSLITAIISFVCFSAVASINVRVQNYGYALFFTLMALLMGFLIAGEK